MTLEDRLERLSRRTPPADPADLMVAARTRAESRLDVRSPRFAAAQENRDLANLGETSAELDTGRRSRMPVLVGVAASAVLVLALGVLLVGGSSSDGTVEVASDGSDSSEPVAVSVSVDPPTQEEIQAATERLLEAHASGWVPYSGSLVMEDYRQTDETIGYLATGPEYLLAERQPVADQPDGRVIGYHYSMLGLVPVDVADSPTFDAAQLRIERYGCDPWLGLDTACDPYAGEDTGEDDSGR